LDAFIIKERHDKISMPFLHIHSSNLFGHGEWVKIKYISIDKYKYIGKINVASKNKQLWGI